MILSLNACGKSNDVTQEKKKEAVTEEEDQEKSEESEKPSEEEKIIPEEENTDVGNEAETMTEEVSIFYPNPETGEMTSKIVKMAQMDAQLIWKELQATGVVGGNTGVLGIEVDANARTIDLDLNQHFGDELRSMGTTGENEMIDSVVSTYLEAFGCEKLKITEEGKTLASGHKEYTNHMEKR